MNSRPYYSAWLFVLAASLPLAAAESRTRDAKQGQSAREAERPAQAEAVPQGVRDDYVLQPQDVVRVHVFQEDEINKQGEVSLSGESTVTLPLVGVVNLRGKTVRQAEDAIRTQLETYLVKPQVAVFVIKYSDRSVSIIGAVNSAGRIQFPQERGLSILEAISLAGGHSRLADLKRVKLTRKGETKEINVDEIMKRGAQDPHQLEVGDVIFVPERIL
jgi:polysaccharide biosynthesis/export protein